MIVVVSTVSYHPHYVHSQKLNNTVGLTDLKSQKQNLLANKQCNVQHRAAMLDFELGVTEVPLRF